MFRKYHNGPLFLIVIPLALSSFIHLWNPVGFPAIWVVEGQYIQRAMSVLDGLDLEDSKDINPRPYDHPFFGQILLAGVFAMIGYPELFVTDIQSTEMDNAIKVLYSVPRILMGLLAVVDTFLVYRIAEHRYNKTIAFLAAVLFAVTPITWILQKIILESILLPFLLLSILFALYSNNQNNNIFKSKTDYRTIRKIIEKQDILLALVSGIFLGLSILTKVPAFTMIPLVGYLICIRTDESGSRNIDLKKLGVWLIPVILVPLIWPVHSLLSDNFGLWLRDLSWNLQREHVTDNAAVGSSLLNSLDFIFQIDPVIFLLGCGSIVFCYIKRDHFLLLWTVPFLIFLFVIDFVSFFHLILLLPVVCISAARLIVDCSNRVKRIKLQQILPLATISVIGAFCLLSSTTLINLNVSSSYFDIYTFVVNSLVNHNPSNEDMADNDEELIMLGRHWTRGYFWIPKHVFDLNVDFKKIDGIDDIPIPSRNDKILLIVDNQVKDSVADSDMSLIKKYYYNYTITPITTFQDRTVTYDTSKYPYASLSENRDLKWVQIRGFNISK
jgi:hypothetical protein